MDATANRPYIALTVLGEGEINSYASQRLQLMPRAFINPEQNIQVQVA